MRRVTLHLAEGDVRKVKRDGFKNVVLILLSRETKTLWQMTECGIGLEIVPPHRVSVVCPEYRKLWWKFQETGVLEPCDLELELSDGASPASMPGTTLSTPLNKATEETIS